MLGHTGNKVFASIAVLFRRTKNCQVVRFGRAACKDDFVRASVNQASDLHARMLNGSGCFRSIFVINARCITKMLVEIGQHGLDDPRVNRGSRMMIHVNRKS